VRKRGEREGEMEKQRVDERERERKIVKRRLRQY